MAKGNQLWLQSHLRSPFKFVSYWQSSDSAIVALSTQLLGRPARWLSLQNDNLLLQRQQESVFADFFADL